MVSKVNKDNVNINKLQSLLGTPMLRVLQDFLRMHFVYWSKK